MGGGGLLIGWWPICHLDTFQNSEYIHPMCGLWIISPNSRPIIFPFLPISSLLPCKNPFPLKVRKEKTEVRGVREWTRRAEERERERGEGTKDKSAKCKGRNPKMKPRMEREHKGEGGEGRMHRWFWREQKCQNRQKGDRSGIRPECLKSRITSSLFPHLCPFSPFLGISRTFNEMNTLNLSTTNAQLGLGCLCPFLPICVPISAWSSGLSLFFADSFVHFVDSFPRQKGIFVLFASIF